MRPLLTLLFLTGFVLSTPAPLAAQSRGAVREMLSGIEDAPTREEWVALGPSTLPVLVALFDDEGELPLVRMRTLWAARFYPTAASRSFLGRVISDRDQPGLWVRAALESLAAAFGPSAVPEIAPTLSHADVAVREGAIRALGRLGGSEARAALLTRRGAERDEALSALLTETLGALSR